MRVCACVFKRDRESHGELHERVLKTTQLPVVHDTARECNVEVI